MKRKICVFTGTRAEYGILRPLIGALKDSDRADLQLLVSAMHLSPEFGSTVHEIEADGFPIAERVEVLLSSDSAVGTAKSVGLGLIGYCEAFARLAPELIVILGDRFEAFAAASAALVCGVPIVHLHGGELSLGAIDDALRHAITKLSHLHLVSTEESRRRVIQMGEAPERVFNVGALGLTDIRKGLLERQALEASLGFVLDKNTFLVTYHPETIVSDSSRATEEVFAALATFTEGRYIFTLANADAGGRAINARIESFVGEHAERSVSFPSLGRVRYLSAMQFVGGVIGNSSSGIIEAPSFQTGTINIGARQEGRVRADSVIDCPAERKQIATALEKLRSAEFQAQLSRTENPYARSDTLSAMMKVLLDSDPSQLAHKCFHDIDFLDSVVSG